jgi:hypothetical protein
MPGPDNLNAWQNNSYPVKIARAKKMNASFSISQAGGFDISYPVAGIGVVVIGFFLFILLRQRK